MSDRPMTTATPILGTMLDRRRFLRISAASAAALMAAGLIGGRAARAQGSLDGVTLDFIGIDGEDGQVELEAWRTENGVTLAKTPFSSWDELFAKLKTDVFDLALVANPYVSLWGTGGRADAPGPHPPDQLERPVPGAARGRLPAGRGRATCTPSRSRGATARTSMRPSGSPRRRSASRSCWTRRGRVASPRSTTRSSSSTSSRSPRATPRP